MFAVTTSADVRGSSVGTGQDAGSEDERDGCQGRDVEAKERRGRSDHGRIDSSLLACVQVVGVVYGVCLCV
jgi:hypothetical protein